MDLHNDFVTKLLEDIKNQSDQAISSMMNVGIQKGYISVRQSDPVIIKSKDTDQLVFHHSLVIDYHGSEIIEQLREENAYLKKINGDLHSALSEFYEKTKVNQWLKRPQT